MLSQRSWRWSRCSSLLRQLSRHTRRRVLAIPGSWPRRRSTASSPVTFAVSGNGTTLTNFRYSSFGCFGAGGFQPGIDYYTKPQAIIKVGRVKVSKAGHFSASGAVSTYTAFGNTTKTTSKVSGSFTSAKAAKGTISFGQKVTGKFKSSCGPAVLSFTVKVK